MEVKLVTGTNQAWDRFVDSSNNGTIFHKLKFLSYHPKKRFAFHHLMFIKDNKVIALIPGELKEGVYRSPAGASYGSFVTNCHTFSDYEEIIDSFISYLKKKKCRKITLTPPPLFYLKEINDYESFILQYKGFKTKHHLITSAINLGSIQDEKKLMMKMQKRFTINVKKSFYHNLKIIFCRNYQDFYPILVDNKKKFNLAPTHTLAEMIRIARSFPKEIKMLMAYDEDRKPIAGLFLVTATQETLLAFYISHYYHYHKKKAVNRLLFEGALWAKKNNFRWFDLGVSMETSSTNPMEPRRSLIVFKEGLGTVGFLRSTYEMVL